MRNRVPGDAGAGGVHRRYLHVGNRSVGNVHCRRTCPPRPAARRDKSGWPSCQYARPLPAIRPGSARQQHALGNPLIIHFVPAAVQGDDVPLVLRVGRVGPSIHPAHMALGLERRIPPDGGPGFAADVINEHDLLLHRVAGWFHCPQLDAEGGELCAGIVIVVAQRIVRMVPDKLQVDHLLAADGKARPGIEGRVFRRRCP